MIGIIDRQYADTPLLAGYIENQYILLREVADLERHRRQATRSTASSLPNELEERKGYVVTGSGTVDKWALGIVM